MTTTTSVDPHPESLAMDVQNQAGPSTQPHSHPNPQQRHSNHTNIDPNLDPSLHSHPHSMGGGSHANANIDPALTSTSAEFGPHDSHAGASNDGQGQGLALSSTAGPSSNGSTGNSNNDAGTVIAVSGVGNVVSVGGTSVAGPSGTPLLPGLGLNSGGSSTNNGGPGPNAISAAKAKVRAEEAAGILISQRTRSPTPPRALFRSTTGKGVAFTDEDVVFLIKLLEWRRVQGKSDMVTFWKEIAQKVRSLFLHLSFCLFLPFFRWFLWAHDNVIGLTFRCRRHIIRELRG